MKMNVYKGMTAYDYGYCRRISGSGVDMELGGLIYKKDSHGKWIDDVAFHFVAGDADYVLLEGEGYGVIGFSPSKGSDSSADIFYWYSNSIETDSDLLHRIMVASALREF